MTENRGEGLPEKDWETIKREAKPTNDLRVIDVTKLVLPYVNPATKRVITTNLNSTVFEVIGGKLGTEFEHDSFGQAIIPKEMEGCTLEHKVVRYFSKQVYLEGGEVPEWLWPKLGEVMNELVNAGKVGYGTLASVMMLPLAAGKQQIVDYEELGDNMNRKPYPPGPERKTYQEGDKLPTREFDFGPPRALICWYVGLDFETEELNEFLGEKLSLRKGRWDCRIGILLIDGKHQLWLMTWLPGDAEGSG